MRLLKKLHTYAGLLTFINLAVYGIVGLSITVLRKANDPPPIVYYQNFTVEANLTDHQVAERICKVLNLSLATPVNSFAIQRDPAKNLLLDLRHVNGRHQITVLEKEGRIRVEATRKSLIYYLFTLHETTAAFHSGDWRMQLWADYNEFAMWSLLLMLATGFGIFLGSRARSRLAQVSLAAGCLVFATLYLWSK
jgi:hypothetical protein